MYHQYTPAKIRNYNSQNGLAHTSIYHFSLPNNLDYRPNTDYSSKQTELRQLIKYASNFDVGPELSLGYPKNDLFYKYDQLKTNSIGFSEKAKKFRPK